jgi:hypothetical protein
VGAGDIAVCGSPRDEQTADLLDAVIADWPDAVVFAAGDNAYESGTQSEFTDCYGPSWGRHKGRTRPVPGNHDYQTANASGYFSYFGGSAGNPTQGYYSYNLGRWHIVALNSEIDMRPGSPQEQWLRQDLAMNDRSCTLAYWHRPRFSSGEHKSDSRSAPLWAALYEYGAEIIVVGHDHNYERFAPMSPQGTLDPGQGIRQFVVGTGGVSLRSVNPIPNSEVTDFTSHGVIKFTLFDGGYYWEFLPIAGRNFRDAGTGTCH